jgi:DNA-directed RNA polymerase specialized sigma24 family protein
MNARYDRAWQTALHERFCAGDVTAFSELAIAAFAYLRIAPGNRLQDENTDKWYDIVIEALYRYKENPYNYDREKSSLFTYLYMDARGDMLNFLEKQRRQPMRRFVSTDEIADDLAEDADDDPYCPDFYTLDLDQIIAMLGLSPTNEAILRLRLEGKRNVADFAQILNIAELPIDQQRRIVKHKKDWLHRWLRTNGSKKLKYG